MAIGAETAGSVMDLSRDTEHEVCLERHEPDGGHGYGVRSLSLLTNAEPKAPLDVPVRHMLLD
jgi:hypothetical protein